MDTIESNSSSEKKQSTGAERAIIPNANREQIEEFVKLLWVANGCLELRVIGDKGSSDYKARRTRSGFYDNPTKLIDDAISFHGKSPIYIGLNPRMPELLHAQPANVLQEGEGGKNSDVLVRKRIVIDIDTKRRSNRVAASNEEIRLAESVHDAVLSHLLTKGVEPLRGFSGNGRHLWIETIEYLPSESLDGKNGKFALLLRWFNRKFGNEYAEIDKGVFDPARVWKVYGTASIKGGNTIERPWRIATIEIPRALPRPIDILSLFAEEIEEQRRFEGSKGPGEQGKNQKWDLGSLDVISLFQNQELYIGPHQNQAHRVKCPWEADHSTGNDGDGSTVVFDRTVERLPGFKCLHGHCAQRSIHDVLEFFGADVVKQFCKLRFYSQTSDKRKFELISLGELMARPAEEYDWVVDGLLAKSGTSLVAGKPKSGKTTLIRQLALAVARGHSFLGRTVILGPVVYLAVEEKAEEVKRHFIEMGATGIEPIFIQTAATPADVLQTHLRPTVLEIRPALVILDTLFRIVRVKDSNDYAIVNNALEPINELARETGAHFLCVHHLGKGERDGMDGVLGSTAINGAFDTLVSLNRKEKDGTRSIKSQQRYGRDLEETVLTFDEATRMSSLGKKKWQVESEIFEAKLFDLFTSQKGSLTKDEISQEIGGNRSSNFRKIESMFERGFLLRIGGGKRGDPHKYSLNPNAPFSVAQERVSSVC